MTVNEDERAEREAYAALLIGRRLRWRRVETQRWMYATVVAINRDRSLHVRTDANKPRDLRPELVELRTDGPRGGDLWVPMANALA